MHNKRVAILYHPYHVALGGIPAVCYNLDLGTIEHVQLFECILRWFRQQYFSVSSHRQLASESLQSAAGQAVNCRSLSTCSIPHPWVSSEGTQLSRSFSFTSTFVISGYFDSRQAMAPDTTGVAMEVPLLTV